MDITTTHTNLSFSICVIYSAVPWSPVTSRESTNLTSLVTILQHRRTSHYGTLSTTSGPCPTFLIGYVDILGPWLWLLLKVQTVNVTTKNHLRGTTHWLKLTLRVIDFPTNNVFISSLLGHYRSLCWSFKRWSRSLSTLPTFFSGTTSSCAIRSTNWSYIPIIF